MVNPWNEVDPFDYSGLWLGCRSVQQNVNQKVSGDPKVDWFGYALREHFTSKLDGRCLMLGASEGGRVRELCEAGFVGEIVATDIADRALGRAHRSLAGFDNVTYVVADLNDHRFDGLFDFIVAEGVLHHIERLEPCVRHLAELLAHQGLLIAVEYEGPFRFQLSAPQVAWINAALSVLPGELRPFWEGEAGTPPGADFLRRVHYVPATEESIRELDPSEAVSGWRLRTLLPRIFHVKRRVGFGGTLLSYMTGHFPFERANDDAYVDRFLRLLLAIEDAVISAGLLNDDFVYYELTGQSVAGDKARPWSR